MFTHIEKLGREYAKIKTVIVSRKHMGDFLKGFFFFSYYGHITFSETKKDQFFQPKLTPVLTVREA